MPNNTRGDIKQKLGRASANLEAALAHVVLVGQAYETEHPDYFEAFAAVAQMINKTSEALNSLIGEI